MSSESVPISSPANSPPLLPISQVSSKSPKKKPAINPNNLRKPVDPSNPETASKAPSKPANASRKPKPMPKFNLQASLHRLCNLVSVTPSECQERGLPLGFGQWLPDQAKLEEYIFQQYIVYNRRYQAYDIFTNIWKQLDEMSIVSRQIHPDYIKVISAIYQDCFIQEMPDDPTATKPLFRQRAKKKWCNGCNKLLVIEAFEPQRHNKDKFYRFCIRCNVAKRNARQKETEVRLSRPPLPQEIYERLNPSQQISPDDLDSDELDDSPALDNPDHDIFDELE